LRFPEFKGEWKTFQIENLCDEFKSGKNIKSEDISENGNYPVYGGNGLRGFTQKYNYDGEHVLIGRQGALCGNVRIVKGKCYMTEHAIVVLGNEKSSTRFLLYLLDRMNLGKYSDQSAQPGLAVNKLLRIKVVVPKFLEQKKIALFLSVIDERIKAQSKIIEKYESLMRGLRENLLSQKLKFKDDNANDFHGWEVMKLKEVMSIPKKNKPIYIDENKLLTVKLHLKGVSKNTSTETLSLGATNYFIRKKGQFIYGKQNLFNGAFGLIPDELDGFLSSGDVPTLDIIIEKLNGDFLVYYFSKESFYKGLEGISSGSGSKRIHETTLLNVEIQIPSIEEQVKIASSLSYLDKRIRIEKQLLLKLVNQKKYLLSNLFI
jgi:type I restriction enzyme S subunit